MEKEADVRAETGADRSAAFAALDRLLDGMSNAQRRALLQLLLAATA